jgi:predicted transcriptional regulator
LAGIFSELLTIIKFRHLELLERPTVISRLNCEVRQTGEPGRPSFNISAEMLEDLRGYGFSWTKIAQILGVSRWTIY